MVAPSRHILLVGAPTTIPCLINDLVMEMSCRYGDDLKMRVAKLPHSYGGNDVFFSMRKLNWEEECD